MRAPIVSRIHIKENSKNIFPFAHILMYAGLGVISAYIHEKGIKSHAQKILSVFRDDLGNIKGTNIVHGVQRVYRGTGKAINVWSNMCDKISCNKYHPPWLRVLCMSSLDLHMLIIFHQICVNGLFL